MPQSVSGRLSPILEAASVPVSATGITIGSCSRKQRLSIAVLETEGLYAPLLLNADLLVKSSEDALDLLLDPKRLISGPARLRQILLSMRIEHKGIVPGTRYHKRLDRPPIMGGLFV